MGLLLGSNILGTWKPSFFEVAHMSSSLDICSGYLEKKLKREFTFTANNVYISSHSSYLTMWQLQYSMWFQLKILTFVEHSVQFSCSVVSDSLRPHESQHSRPPCPSPTPEFTQIHVHRVSDAIQPSHPLSSPFPPALNPSQHQSLFQWVNSSQLDATKIPFKSLSLEWFIK